LNNIAFFLWLLKLLLIQKKKKKKKKDNGVKLVEPLGEMLKQSWEGYCTELANAETEDAMIESLKKVISEENIPMDASSSVVIARDTR